VCGITALWPSGDVPVSDDDDDGDVDGDDVSDDDTLIRR
jgi:hypothetical protein